MKIPGLSFSLKRALGVTAVKQKIARKTGVPLTKQGAERKIGSAILKDYSTIGTQSCHGRVPVKGEKTIYLAFENERMRYTNYLWVDVEAVVPQTVYYTTKYSIK